MTTQSFSSVVGNDGKLYPQNTVNTPGIFPIGVAAAGSFLYVLDTYQPLPACNTAAPCSGSIAVFPILTASQAAALTPPATGEHPRGSRSEHEHQRQLLAAGAFRQRRG